MNLLGGMIPSEMSHAWNNKYFMISLICGVQKKAEVVEVDNRVVTTSAWEGEWERKS